MNSSQQKYCKFCGALIDADCVICPRCGKQIEEIRAQNPNIYINNNVSSLSNAQSVGYFGRPKNKWVALLLCIFTGFGHKFYEGKIGMGILYIFTVGLFGIGWIVDIISLATKPNPYYV